MINKIHPFFLLLIPLIDIQGQSSLPVIYDFRADTVGNVREGIFQVCPETKYISGGYGIITDGAKSYADDPIPVVDKTLSDGVVTDGLFHFRTHIPTGKFLVELSLGAGTKSIWRGKIVINDALRDTSLVQYKSSFEADDPPLYWSRLYPVQDMDSLLDIRISGNGQPVMVSYLRIFPANYGPIRWKEGRIIETGNLEAPNASLAIKLINQGAIQEAERIIAIIEEKDFGYEKALLLLALSSRMEIESPVAYIEWARRLLESENQINGHPDIILHLNLIRKFTDAVAWSKMGGYDWAVKSTGAGIFPRQDLAAQLLENGLTVDGYPLQTRFAWELGKIAFWMWVEEHAPVNKTRADSLFAWLYRYYPKHELLREYMGNNPWPDPVKIGSVDTVHPAWAVYSDQALQSVNSLINFWVTNRQASNGELGGKYDDDVEILRWWPVSILASGNDTALMGMKRLVDGIWNSGWIYKGFSKKVRDVEHSSEPVSDTQPLMIGFEFGNPVYVERCMESIKGIRDLWTGMNSRGHRHFKSGWYSSTRIDTTPPKDCDLPMNARTVNALRWLAWYNQHPFALQFLREWGDAWLEDCLRTDNGKPYGVVPSAIRYSDDAIGGHADNWHHPGLFWRYYDFNGGIHILNQLLVTWILTSEDKYLEPIYSGIRIIGSYTDDQILQAEVGSEAWVAGVLKKSDGFAQTLEQWRLYSGDNRYDSLLTKMGSDYLKYRLTGDKELLSNGAYRILEGSQRNRKLLTSEGMFTDRIEIGDMHKAEDWGTDFLQSMYLGNTTSSGFFPFYRISYEGFPKAFSSLVLENTSNHLRVLVYNLDTVSHSGQINLWMMKPGLYQFLQGNDHNQDDIADDISSNDQFNMINHFGTHPLVLPPGKVQVLEIKLMKSYEQPGDLADLAITGDELRIRTDEHSGDKFLEIPVHNIGTAAAAKINVRLLNEEKEIAKQLIEKLPAPLDLEPKIQVIRFRLSLKELQKHSFRIMVSIENNKKEITLLNNVVQIKL